MSVFRAVYKEQESSEGNHKTRMGGIQRTSGWNPIYTRMEGHISIEKRDDRESICGVQGEAWIKIYKIKRAKEKSTGIVDHFWLS